MTIGPIGATSHSGLSLRLVEIVLGDLDPTPSSCPDPFGLSRLHPAGMPDPIAPERDPAGQRRVSRLFLGRQRDGAGGASPRLDPEIWDLPDSPTRATSVQSHRTAA
jgi:hypothetical protein